MAQQQQQQQQQGAAKAGLSDEMLKIIHGHVDHGDKRDKYQESLQRWWKDYSHRKNDEEDMVADSLLYDERCHLPRTTPGPKAEPEPEVNAAAGPATPPPEKEEQTTEQQQNVP